MPKLIENLEIKLEKLQAELAQSYASNGKNSAALAIQSQSIQTELAALYTEWEDLL